MQKKALFGLFSGIVLIVVTLIGVETLSMPTVPSAVASPRTAAVACEGVPKASEGYGIVSRQDCSTDE